MSLPKPDGLVAPVRHLADDRDVVVDPDAAGLDLPGGPRDAEDVAGPDRGGQPVRRVVGQRDRLVVGVERQHGEHRAEDLVAARSRALWAVDDDQRRLVVGARPPGSPPGAAPPQTTSAPAPGPGRRSRPPGRVRGETSGPRSVAGSRGSPSRTPAIRSATPATKSSYERALHDGAGRGRAVLTGVDQRAGDGAVDGGLQVGVVEDHERRLAAELEVHPLRRRRRRSPSPDDRRRWSR